MKKIYLTKTTQFNMESYVGTIDPRDLIKTVIKPINGKVPEAQRPYEPKRSNQIAKHVSKEGLLPSSVTLATKDNRFELNKTDLEDVYYIEYPDCEEEYIKFENSLYLIDGQHRVLGFSEMRLLSDDVKYSIPFNLYFVPTLKIRRILFIACNKNNKNISENLFLYYSDILNLLTPEDKWYYNFIKNMNTTYPLEGKIIISCEQISSGFKAVELLKILKKSNFYESCNGDEEVLLKGICTYLSCWESVCGFSFSKSSPSKVGPAVKISGLRYMLSLMKAFEDRAVKFEEKITNKDFIKSIIKHLISEYGCERNRFFIEHNEWFADRSATSNAVKEATDIIKNLKKEPYNPWA